MSPKFLPLVTEIRGKSMAFLKNKSEETRNWNEKIMPQASVFSKTRKFPRQKLLQWLKEMYSINMQMVDCKSVISMIELHSNSRKVQIQN